MTGDARPQAADGGLFYPQPGGRFTAIMFLPLAAIWVATAFGFADRPTWIRIGAVVFSVLAAVVAVAQWRAGIYVDQTELFGRRQLGRRNRRVEWADVDHFELRGYWRGLGARTVDGQWVPLMIYGGFSGQAMEIAASLEADLMQRRHAAEDRADRSSPKRRGRDSPGPGSDRPSLHRLG